MRSIDDFFRGLDDLIKNLTRGIERDVEEFGKAQDGWADFGRGVTPGETVERTTEESTTTHASGAVTKIIKTTVVRRIVRKGGGP